MMTWAPDCLINMRPSRILSNRIESGLLKNISTELIDFVKPDCLTELGSGASEKPSTCLMLVIGRTTVCFMSQLTCAGDA